MISVVVATYDRLEKLARCIRTLHEAHRGKLDYEVIVVLDGGPHAAETRAIAEKYSAKFVHLEQNSGCGYANNAGIQIASVDSDCVVVVNDDVWFEEAACLKLCSIIRKNDRIGIVGARLLYPDGIVQHAGLDARILHIARGLPGQHPLALENRDAVAVTSALMCISKKLLSVVHGFDTRYRMGYEDVDICFKAREAGWRTHYLGDAWAFHDEGGTRGQSAELGANRTWSEWNNSGHDVFFHTWSSDRDAFCYDSITFVVATTGVPSFSASLDCLRNQISARDEVVVVDSGSVHQMHELVESFGASFRYVHSPESTLADKFNLGFRCATGCTVVFIQEGGLYAEGALSSIRCALKKHPLKPILFSPSAEAGLGNVLPQMILVPNCPDFVPAWDHEKPTAAEAAESFVQSLRERWPNNALVQQAISLT